MKSKEIRSTFLKFFEKYNHHILPASSLVPSGDATLLFTNAGMVQFKDIFTGKLERSVPRAATCQKCVRAGGKHNDLENVGYTARHHTFFEMLGNFSFGDYFKELAIQLAWEFLVETLKLPKEKLWVSIYRDDEEAYRIWTVKMGVPESKILRFGEKDNFWAMGETGPCGPCSEILIDQGPAFGCGSPDCKPGCDCDRYLELWNLVFMQYYRSEKGELSSLPKPSIDTGMGLERITAVLQGVRSNYETDLFQPLISFIEENCGKTYQIGSFSAKDNVSMRVIADHARAGAFLIADGVHPANEGRGYVLRRIIRRAARHAKMIGIDKPFLFQTADQVVELMQEIYPELSDRRAYISTIIRQEEERFIHTLERGMAVLEEIIEKAAKAKEPRVVPGEEIFKLYDTFGFPIDIAQDMLKENNLVFDENGFKAAMERQRQMARQSWQGMDSGANAGSGILKVIGRSTLEQLAKEFPPAHFLGYEAFQSSVRVLALLKEGQRVTEAGQDEEVEVIIDQTPFYAEKGGQVGDIGVLENERMRAVVWSVQSPVSQLIIHRCQIKKGQMREGDVMDARVDYDRRQDIARNHTATHLLQAALKQVLGDHIKQAGSLVAQDRLRFDFTHFMAVSSDELEQIESLINEKIRRDSTVQTDLMSLEEAVKVAVALFGEKYEQQVRVVRIGDFSAELCGGTHLSRTGEIGLFKILSESSIAAGVRRIEAITGLSAYQYLRKIENEVSKAAKLLKSDSTITPRIEQLLASLRQKEKEVEQLKEKLSATLSSEILKYRKKIDGISVLAYHVKELELNSSGLRNMADLLKDKMSSGIIVLANTEDSKVNLVAVVTRDLTDRFHAGNIIKKISAIVGGSGGGRPDMAQAGGNRPEKLPEALAKVMTEVLPGEKK